jgi:hypothetical protein
MHLVAALFQRALANIKEKFAQSRSAAQLSARAYAFK